MEINETLDQLVELVKTILSKNKTKVIGIDDLNRAARKAGFNIPLDEDNVAELCFRLREENIICRPQGCGIFKHIRIIE
jgi:hypothetical protein